MKKEEKYTYNVILKQGGEEVGAPFKEYYKPNYLYTLFTTSFVMTYDEFIDRYAIIEIHSIKQFNDYGNFETETINKRVLPPVEYLTKI